LAVLTEKEVSRPPCTDGQLLGCFSSGMNMPSVLTVFENNDDCSAIIFAAPLKNSFPYKTAAHSCNSQTFLPNMSNL
jgi:hypothetical protein